jgi:hypothetical protein
MTNRTFTLAAETNSTSSLLLRPKIYDYMGVKYIYRFDNSATAGKVIRYKVSDGTKIELTMDDLNGSYIHEATDYGDYLYVTVALATGTQNGFFLKIPKSLTGTVYKYNLPTEIPISDISASIYKNYIYLAGSTFRQAECSGIDSFLINKCYPGIYIYDLKILPLSSSLVSPIAIWKER